MKFLKLLLVLLFLTPFQSRMIKLLKPLSKAWIDPSWKFPNYFETSADIFITDFLFIALGIIALYKIFKKTSIQLRVEQILLSCFFIVAVVSILFSNYPFYPLSYWRLAHMMMAAIPIYFLSLWIKTREDAFWSSMIKTVVITAVLQSIIALTQYGLQSHIGLKSLGEPKLISKEGVGAGFGMPRKALTSIDYYWKADSSPGIVVRASGTFAHCNILGGFLVISLLMTLLWYEKSEKKKVLAALIILQVITLFTTFSRAAIFTALGGTLLWMLFYFINFKTLSTSIKPLLIAFCSAFLLFFPQLFYRGGVISHNTLVHQSDENRQVMRHQGQRMIKDHPWLGVGFNQYLLELESYTQGRTVSQLPIHNIYVLVAVEMGLIGLVCFILFCAQILYQGWRTRQTLEGQTFLVLFISFLMIGMVDYYPLFLQPPRILFFFIAALVSCWSCVCQKLPKPMYTT